MALSLSLDHALGGAGWLYHAGNLVFHGAAAVLVARVGVSFGISRAASVWGAGLFLVHPLTSVVASAIAFRSEAMMTCALLGMLLCHRAGHPLRAGLLALVAALCKETGWLMAPAFIVAIDLDPRWRSPCPRVGRLRGYALLAAPWLIGVGLRLAFAPPWRAKHLELPFGLALGTRLGALGTYAIRLVVPWESWVCDSFPLMTPWRGPAILGGAVVLLSAWLAWRGGGLHALLFLSLLPSLQLVPVMRWWSPHYVYLSLALAGLLLASATSKLRLTTRMPTAAFATAALLVLAVFSFRQARRFTSDESLWQPEVAQDPSCLEGHFFLGTVAMAKGDVLGAETHFAHALAGDARRLAYVDRGAALQNLGVAQMHRSRFADARAAFEAALEVSRGPEERRQLIHNLAAVAFSEGDLARTVSLLENEPDLHEASRMLLARALAALGR